MTTANDPWKNIKLENSFEILIPLRKGIENVVLT
jgi:hypothetical protein